MLVGRAGLDSMGFPRLSVDTANRRGLPPCGRAAVGLESARPRRL